MIDSDFEFDEGDEDFMDLLGEAIDIFVPQIFQENLEADGKTHVRKHAPVSEMSERQIESFLDVVKECLGPFYKKHKGPDWASEKFLELSETGLVYIWYENEGEISCFLSMMIVSEAVGKTLYLYEIQVLPKFQGHHLGARLINDFHKCGKILNELSQNADSELQKHFSCSATGLTVFSDNERALKWYFKLGYDFSRDSPYDRRLRDGKIIKPSFYILTRCID